MAEGAEYAECRHQALADHTQMELRKQHAIILLLGIANAVGREGEGLKRAATTAKRH